MTYYQDEAITTASPPKLYQVRLRSGKTWTGTKRELMNTNPAWWPYAKEVQGGDVLELDFADDPHPGRLPSSSKRYYMPDIQSNTTYEAQPEILKSPIPARKSATTTAQAAQAAPRRKNRRLFGSFRAHPLIWLGVGMFLMLGLWTLFTIAVNWWNVTQDDLHYGRPRTAQYDVVLGFDNDSPAHKTHVIVMNLNRHIIIVVLPAGDVSKSVIYGGPYIYGRDADLTPVTLTFQDTTGNGKLDMLVHFQGSEIVYLNQNGKFVPQQLQP